MWIATTIGFFSVVQSKRARLTVRARSKKDLVALVARLPKRVAIVSTPHADYPFRCYVTRKMLAWLMFDLVLDIHYPNFKNEVAKTSLKRARGTH